MRHKFFSRRPILDNMKLLIWFNLLLSCVTGCGPTNFISLDTNHEWVGFVEWNYDGTKLAVAHRKRLDIWDTKKWTLETLEQSIGDSTSNIVGVAWKPDGHKIASTHLGVGLTIWDVALGTVEVNVDIGDSVIGDLFWPTNGGEILLYYTFFDKSYVNIISLIDNKPSSSIIDLGQVTSFPNDLCWLRTSEDGKISIVQIQDYVLSQNKFEWIDGICSPNGMYFATYNSEHFKLDIWNIQTYQLMTSIARVSQFDDFMWSPNGNTLFGGGYSGNRLILWHSTKPDQPEYINLPDGNLSYIAGPNDLDWSPDSNKVAFVAGPSGFEDVTPRTLVLIWDVDQKRFVQTLRMDKGDGIGCIDWHPANSQLAVGGSEGVKVWDIATNKP